MANTAIMEDTATRREDRRDERRTAAEQEHKSRISENYRKLLFDNNEEWTAAGSQTLSNAQSAPAAAPAATATLERTPVMPVHESVATDAQEQTNEYSANTAQRLADYVAYAPAKGKRMLFEGIAYKNGELIDMNAAPAPAAAAAPAVAPAPVFAPAPAEVPAAPVSAPAAEDDALPTRRTLDTLRRSAEMTETQEQTNTGFLSALSLKTKLLLCAIAAAVVLIIALICVNTGLLSAANADIVGKEAQLRELQARYAEVADDLDYYQSEEFINEWADSNGMVRGE